MRLRSNEVCPVHRSTSCCGREILPKPKPVRPGVQRVEDPHHPRGYRELRSPAETRKTAEPQGATTGRDMRHLPRRIHGLQRHRPRSQGTERDGRSLERRSPGQYPGNPLVVQRRERINKNGVTHEAKLFALSRIPASTTIPCAILDDGASNRNVTRAGLGEHRVALRGCGRQGKPPKRLYGGAAI